MDELSAIARRWFDDLLAGRSNTCGTFTLAAAPATSTTVIRRGVSASSVVLHHAYSALASNADITRTVEGNDEFTVYHTASANVRTFKYSFKTGVQT